MEACRIERYFRPETGHPAIVAVGQSVQTKARDAFGRHRHAHLECCLVTNGGIEYLTGNRRYWLKANSVQISQPKEIHGTPEERLYPCTLTWIQVDVPALGSRELGARLSSLPTFLDDGATVLLPHLACILDECRSPARDRWPVLHASLWTFLAQLIRLANRTPDLEHPTTLRRALEFVEADPGFELTVDALCKKLNTHRSHLYELFVSRLGISPHAWIKERRMKRAAERLTSSAESITDVAHALGYSSTQHFATAFKARYGQTPSAFRRQFLL